MNILILLQNYPKTSIMIIAFLVTLVITIVNSLMIDKKRMKEIKDKQKLLRAEMKKCKDNPTKVMELNKQMMEDLPEQMKQSFKPLLITMIPLLILFKWLRQAFLVTPIAGTWFWWYIGGSLVFSIVLRKIFGLQ